MTAQEEYIEKIKESHVQANKEYVLDSLTGAIDRLQKAFPRYGSFLMEFIQNADDARSPSVKIEILEDTIRIFNNGDPFSEKDVKSICKVGRSSKTAKEYIGYLGVGFKAVFLISESPEIYSGGYRFKFDKNAWPDPEHIPWQIIPVWIDSPNTQLLSEYHTAFNLPLKNPQLTEKLREEVGPEHLSDRILLFLRNIKEIEVNDPPHNLKRRIVKSESSRTSDYEIYKIQEYENDALKTEGYWLIFRSVCDTPGKVREDYTTKEWERDAVDKREVLAAFKLDENGNLTREEKGTAHIGVFSFLPLKEIPSGLNFLLQADFLTVPGRGELTRDCLWNNWLAHEIYKLIVNKCIPIFLNHERYKMNLTNILYSSAQGHELFERYIKSPLNKYLENNAVLIAEDGSLARAEELISVEEEIRELISNEDLKLLYPDKKIMHKECKPHYRVEIKEAPRDIDGFVRSSESEEFIKSKAKNEDIEWFKKLYSMLVDKYNIQYFEQRHYRYNVEHDNFWNKMHSFDRPIILTERGKLAKMNECCTNPQRLKIPEEIRDRFEIVHPELVKDQKFQELRKKLNEERYYQRPPTTKVIGELTEEDIKNSLKKQEILEMDEGKWRELSDDEKIEKIRFFKNYQDAFALEDFKFLTLKAKTGEWARPEELVFSEEYNPEHNIEKLAGKGLLDIPLKFTSPEFIANEGEDEIRKWRKFLETLGVDKKLENLKTEIPQRIAILTALLYERKEGRESRELGESEKPGYDIESNSETEERYIEVKGTGDPSRNIFLTVNEFKGLREKKDKYFIYVVLRALRNPTLHVVQGDKLLEIEDVPVIIPFNKWRDLTDDEFQP